MKISVSPLVPEEVVKEAFWLAWKACGGPLGMGMFQDNPGATKEDVWNNVSRSPMGGDYPSGGGIIYANPNRPGKLYGDYVFGRMIKLGLEYDNDSVTVPDGTPRADYQSWCSTFPTYVDLIETARKNLS